MAISKPLFGHGTGKPHPVDVHVGARARQRRTLLGMSQTDLGDALGLTFRQIQKYERGPNRISASRLYDLARVFDVPIEYFFEDMSPEIAVGAPAPKRRGKAKKLSSQALDPMAKQETLELVRAYYEIGDVDVRKHLREMVRVLGPADV